MRTMTPYTHVLSPEDVARHFALEGARLYRKYSDGSFKQLTSMDNLKVVVQFKGTRILGVDIAWCLLHGNWPKFPIVQIRRDPHDFATDNLYPARMRTLRYRQTEKDGKYYHGSSVMPFRTPTACREAWENFARDFYGKDTVFVLILEAKERELRQVYLREHALANPTRPLERREVAPPSAKPRKPTRVPGMEWHWNAGEWISIPEPCHVADDYRVRIRKVRAGAVRFEYKREYAEVWGFDMDGQVVR